MGKIIGLVIIISLILLSTFFRKKIENSNNRF